MSILNSDLIKETVKKVENGETFVTFSGTTADGEERHVHYRFTDANLNDPRFMDRFKAKMEEVFMP